MSEVDPSSEVLHRQRVAAYGLCIRNAQILLSRLSRATGRPGSWTLPGGGIDHGEPPAEAVVRETHEETGLEVTVHQVLTVDSRHFVGTRPDGRAEDLHSIRIVYLATTTDDAQPRVLDVGGTSDAAAWVPLQQLQEHPVVELVVLALEAAGFSLA